MSFGPELHEIQKNIYITMATYKPKFSLNQMIDRFDIFGITKITYKIIVNYFVKMLIAYINMKLSSS